MLFDTETGDRPGGTGEHAVLFLRARGGIAMDVRTGETLKARAVRSIASQLIGRHRGAAPVVVRTPPPAVLPPIANPERFGCHRESYPRAFHARHAAGVLLAIIG